jgi:uncharacterized protein YacL
MNGLMEKISISAILQSGIAIILGLILGILIDETFDKSKISNIQRIISQFTVIIFVVFLLQYIGTKLPISIVSNVFFISVFLGVQSSLFAEVKKINIIH